MLKSTAVWALGKHPEMIAVGFVVRAMRLAFFRIVRSLDCQRMNEKHLPVGRQWIHDHMELPKVIALEHS